jgi:uroporphyrinogen-III synthase
VNPGRPEHGAAAPAGSRAVDESRPLAGVRVVLTRAERQASDLAAAFAAAGAAVETLPLLEVTPPADPAPLARAAAELRLYDWVVFTSANAVHALLDATEPSASQPPQPPAGRQPPGEDQPPAPRPSPAAALPTAGVTLGAGAPSAAGRVALPPRLRIAAVGAATTAALRARGLEPALVAAPGAQSAAGLLAALLSLLDCGQRVLLSQAADALPTLRDGLLAAGIAAVAVTAYDKRRPAAAPRRAAELFASAPLGWVTFTSPSVVRHFVDLLGEPAWPRRRGELRAASIGPVTSAELRRQGIEPAAEAANPTAADLVVAVAAAVRAGAG